MFNEEAVILENKSIAKDTFLMKLHSPKISGTGSAGQFVNVRCSDGIDPLLRRPISICDNQKDQGIITLAYQVKGKGTQLLSNATGSIELLGPLGRGFTINNTDKNIAVIGGGIGVFPLLYLLKESSAYRNVFLGFRDKESLLLLNEFKENSEALTITTDDGSYGLHCLVTDPCLNLLDRGIDRVYTCGPVPMLKKVAEMCEERNIECQVSLEERMGCGIGACLVCACKVKAKNKDGWEYQHVCKDGPVFNTKDLIMGG